MPAAAEGSKASVLRPLRDVAALEPAAEGGRGVLQLHLRS